MVQNSIERQMLIKYVISWNELAITYQRNKMYFESLECFQTAIIIYEKVLMYGHIQFALGDYILSKLMIYIDSVFEDENRDANIMDNKVESADNGVNEEYNNEELYREILVSSQNRYSHPDYNQNNNGQLDTS